MCRNLYKKCNKKANHNRNGMTFFSAASYSSRFFFHFLINVCFTDRHLKAHNINYCYYYY